MRPSLGPRGVLGPSHLSASGGKGPRVEQKGGLARSFPRLAPSRIAGLGVVIGGIEAGQFHAFLDLAEDPAFIELVFGALVRDEVNEVLWNDHRTIIVDDDDVAGKYRAAATTDRLLPADKRQTIDGCRSGDACTPDWKRARQYTGTVTHDAVGDECRDITLFHACAQNV